MLGSPKRGLTDLKNDLLDEVHKFRQKHSIESDKDSQVKLESLPLPSDVKDQADIILEDLEDEV